MKDLKWLKENLLQVKHLERIRVVGEENIVVAYNEEYGCDDCIFSETCKETDSEEFDSVCSFGQTRIHYILKGKTKGLVPETLERVFVIQTKGNIADDSKDYTLVLTPNTQTVNESEGTSLEILNKFKAGFDEYVEKVNKEFNRIIEIEDAKDT